MRDIYHARCFVIVIANARCAPFCVDPGGFESALKYNDGLFEIGILTMSNSSFITVLRIQTIGNQKLF